MMEPFLLSLIGFRGLTVLGSGLLTIGNILKSSLLPKSRTRLFIAFFLTGLSQPMYQCTPTLLSSNWFPETERTMATGVALNSNQLGIGVAFVAGTIFVSRKEFIFQYFNIITIFSLVTFVGVLFQFQGKPHVEPELEEKNVVSEESYLLQHSSSSGHPNNHFSTHTQLSPSVNFKPYNVSSHEHKIINSVVSEEEEEREEFTGTSLVALLFAYFSEPGFFHSTVAFVLSAVVVNTLSTYMDLLIRLQHQNTRLSVGIIGGLFQLIILISSLFFGKKTDQSRAYYTITLCLLMLGAFALAQCGIFLDDNSNRLRSCLLGVAMLVGPLQPIASELGVDVTFPLGENGVLVIHQLFANLASASFIPIFEKMSSMGSGPKYSSSFYSLVCIHVFATCIFATFNGRYKRLEWERKKKGIKNFHDDSEVEEYHPHYI